MLICSSARSGCRTSPCFYIYTFNLFDLRLLKHDFENQIHYTQLYPQVEEHYRSKRYFKMKPHETTQLKLEFFLSTCNPVCLSMTKYCILGTEAEHFYSNTDRTAVNVQWKQFWWQKAVKCLVECLIVLFLVLYVHLVHIFLQFVYFFYHADSFPYLLKRGKLMMPFYSG